MTQRNTCPQCGCRTAYGPRCFTCSPPDLSTVRGRLARAILDDGRSINVIATASGFSAGMIRNHLAVSGRDPSIFTVSVLAQVLKASPGWIAFGEIL